eukprot:330197_1
MTGKTIALDVEPNDTIQKVKQKIEDIEHVSIQQQTLMFKDIILRNNETLHGYDLGKESTIYLIVNNKEMGLGVGGKMKQKIYADDEKNILKYNRKRVTSVFINIANSVQWKQITKKQLLPSPIDPLIYKLSGYPWYKLYDDKLQDIKPSNELMNIKSIQQIENEQTNKDKSINIKKIIKYTYCCNDYCNQLAYK